MHVFKLQGVVLLALAMNFVVQYPLAEVPHVTATSSHQKAAAYPLRVAYSELTLLTCVRSTASVIAGMRTSCLCRFAEDMACHVKQRHLACRRARLQRPVQAAVPKQIQPQREHLPQVIASSTWQGALGKHACYHTVSPLCHLIETPLPPVSSCLPLPTADSSKLCVTEQADGAAAYGCCP